MPDPKKESGEPEFDLSHFIGGRLNILGLNLDLGKLLAAPEEVREQLEELREKLKQAGGREVMRDEEWQGGAVRVTGYVRTRGLLGDREYHIGATPPPGSRPRPSARAPEAIEVSEPAADVYHEEQEIVMVAEVPGVSLEDLELKVDGRVLLLSTKPGVRRQYRKAIPLGLLVDKESLRASCRNGILEVRLKKPKQP